MRFHVLSVPHTRTSPEFSACAFTQKAAKFIKMMSGRGHEIIHYGHADSEIFSAPDVTHVPVTTDADFLQSYGEEYLAGAWKTKGFAHYYKIDDHVHKTFHANAIKEIQSRKQPNDFILHFWGWGTKPVADAIPDLINVEPGIGYAGAWAAWRIYESHAVWNAISGATNVQYCNQNWYHRVIPNYFDPDDFEYSDTKADYVVFLGRIGSHKGVDTAIQATERAGKRLKIAGQGTISDLGYTQVPDHVEIVGYQTPGDRKKLLSQASALIIASTYIEPFGGVQVEAWLSGTPVISPDWAAFAEYNRPGVGIRCHTMGDFVQALTDVKTIRPIDCYAYGQEFTLKQIAPRYERYFQDVLDVYEGTGWYTPR